MKMIKRLLALIVLLISGLALAVWQVPVVQDAVIDRMLAVALTPAPPIPAGLTVKVCGTASPLGNSSNRAQGCIAVVTPEHFFVFDAGAGSSNRLLQAKLPMERITGVVLTHFHSDHIADLPAINLSSWVAGRQAPLQVYGPVGVESVVGGFNIAYGLDRSYRTAHHGENFMPAALGQLEAVTIAQGVIWDDGKLRIRAVAVDHSPINPAYAYRVDYAGRSVVISGDTNAVDPLFELAEGSDVLFHDALFPEALGMMIAAANSAGQKRIAHVMNDIMDYHAHVATLSARAADANVRQLVLYHLVPSPPNRLLEWRLRREMDDTTIIAQDLMTFYLSPQSQVIEIDR